MTKENAMASLFQSTKDFEGDRVFKVGDIIKFPFEKEEVSHLVEKQGEKFFILTLIDGVSQIMFLEDYLEDLTFKVFEEIFMQEEYLRLNKN